MPRKKQVLSLPLWVLLPGWVWLRKLMNRPLLNCDRCMGPIWGDAEVHTDWHDNVVCPSCSIHFKPLR